MMNARTVTTVLLALAGAACAAGAFAVRPADRARPRPSELLDEVERKALSDAGRHAGLADAARDAGKADEAQAEDLAAADGFASFADRFSGSVWRLVMRRSAVERYLLAGAPQKAVEQAQKVLADAQSDPASKAVAARLTAAAWQAVALAETRAGKLEKLSLHTAAQRKGQPPRPRAPPEPWKRFVEAVDAYLPLASQDPAQKLAGPDRRAAGVTGPADLALIAAEVEYAHDNLEESRRRLDRIIATWPSDASVMENAVPLDLQTFLVQKDDPGYDAAVPRVKAILDPVASEARRAAAMPGAIEEQKRAAEILGRLDDQLALQQRGAGFAQGERLLAAGQYAQAAAAFEKFAAENRDNPDAPNALYNAAIAWDRAKEGKKAAALREQLVKDYPEARVAPQAVVAQASALSRLGEHLAAQKLYGDYLRLWPRGEQRCLALYNRGVEISAAGDDPAAAFVAFGTDERCAKEDPKAAANLLYNAAGIFQKAKKQEEAKSALEAMLGLPPVKDPAVRSWIDDARRRLNAMR